MAGATPPFLSLSDMSVRYGTQPVLDGIGLDVAAGESVAIAGANGAGKSSLFAALAGLAVPGRRDGGTLRFDGRLYDLGRRSPLPGGAIGLVPERDKVFSLLTVAENLAIGFRAQRNDGSGPGADQAYAWFPRLRDRRDALAGNLSGGEQQMLGIAMALLARPRLLLLDEPTLGLAVPVIESLCEQLGKLRRELDLTVLVAESDTQWLPSLAERAVVLAHGRLVERVSALGAVELAAVHDIMVGLAGGSIQDPENPQ